MIAVLLLLHLFAACVSAQGLPFPGPGNSVDTVTTFTDDFARANESPLSKSGAWGQPAGATVNPVDLISNKAKGNTANENIAVVVTPIFPVNYRAQISWASSSANYSRVWVRLSDSGGYMLTTSGPNVLQIFRVDNSGSSLSYNKLGADITPSSSLVTGDRLELQMSGTSLTAYVNDVLVGTRTDSTYASGQPGLGSFLAENIASLFQATSALH